MQSLMDDLGVDMKMLKNIFGGGQVCICAHAE